MDEMVTVPASEFQAIKRKAALVPALERRERALSGLVHTSRADPRKKAVRNAQREARRMNRPPKRRRK